MIVVKVFQENPHDGKSLGKKILPDVLPNKIDLIGSLIDIDLPKDL